MRTPGATSASGRSSRRASRKRSSSPLRKPQHVPRMWHPLPGRLQPGRRNCFVGAGRSSASYSRNSLRRQSHDDCSAGRGGGHKCPPKPIRNIRCRGAECAGTRRGAGSRVAAEAGQRASRGPVCGLARKYLGSLCLRGARVGKRGHGRAYRFSLSAGLYFLCAAARSTSLSST